MPEEARRALTLGAAIAQLPYGQADLKHVKLKRHAPVCRHAGRITMPESPAAEYRKRTFAALTEALGGPKGVQTPIGVRRLVDAMYANMRDDQQSRADMLTNAAFFTGVATAALLDYANFLEQYEQEIERRAELA